MTHDVRRLSVVAFGAVCWAVASATNDWFFVNSEGGWFNDAPNNGVAYSPSQTWILRELVVWLVANAVWFVVSKRLLGPPDNDA